jgi:hypothetical protein
MSWPAGVLITGLVGLLTFPICVVFFRALSVGKSDRAYSGYVLRVGTFGLVLLAIGVAFTLIAYFSSYDETLVIMSAISALYPLAAWRILRDNPMTSDSSEAVRRGATILGVVWMIVGTGLAVFWLSGILTEWSYFSGRRLLGLVAVILLMHVVSSVALHLTGRFVGRLRPLAVSFGWVMGAGAVTFVPVLTVYLGLVGIAIISYIE